MLSKKFLCALFFILMSIPVQAWNYQTHEMVVESAYYSLSEDVQTNLNLTLLKLGAITPDKYFKDNVNHHYPKSFEKAGYWLNKTRFYYDSEDYNKASYAFGIVSHYISDSFSAPHYIKGESWRLHAGYEDQALGQDTNIKTGITSCDKSISFNLNQSLYLAAKESETWQEWVKTKNPEIPMKAVGKATDLVLQTALDVFDATCSKKETIIVKEPFVTLRTILFLLIIPVTLLLLIKIKKRKVKI